MHNELMKRQMFLAQELRDEIMSGSITAHPRFRQELRARHPYEAVIGVLCEFKKERHLIDVL